MSKGKVACLSFVIQFFHFFASTQSIIPLIILLWSSPSSSISEASYHLNSLSSCTWPSQAFFVFFKLCLSVNSSSSNPFSCILYTYFSQRQFLSKSKVCNWNSFIQHTILHLVHSSLSSELLSLILLVFFQPLR